jgi:hypothetical protein
LKNAMSLPWYCAATKSGLVPSFVQPSPTQPSPPGPLALPSVSVEVVEPSAASLSALPASEPC